MDIQRAIRENIAYYLSRLDKQQKEFAKAVDVSEATVTVWLKGNGSPRLDKLDAICEFLHISPAQLVTERRPGLYQTILGEDENRILTKYSSLNIDGKRKLEEHLDLLIASGQFEKNIALQPRNIIA